MSRRTRRPRKDPVSEETHVARGVIGTIVLVLLIIGAIHYYFPPQGSASQPTAQARTVPDGR